MIRKIDGIGCEEGPGHEEGASICFLKIFDKENIADRHGFLGDEHPMKNVCLENLVPDDENYSGITNHLLLIETTKKGDPANDMFQESVSHWRKQSGRQYPKLKRIKITVEIEEIPEEEQEKLWTNTMSTIKEKWRNVLD